MIFWTDVTLSVFHDCNGSKCEKLIILFCILQVAYERVNLADIETSSEEDDYGDLFAHVSHPSCGKKYKIS